jgi:hypothetical protein
MKIDRLDEHFCHKRPRPCPNSCLDENGEIIHVDPTKIRQHRELHCSLEVISCKFAGAGCKISLLRKDMPLHENDAVSHIGCLLEALQTARKEIKELKEFQYTAEEFQHTTERAIDSMQLIFKVSVDDLDDEIQSTTINVSGHRFKLELCPNPDNDEFQSLYLYLDEDTQRNLGTPVSVEASFEVLVNKPSYPVYKTNLKHTYLEPDGFGRENFIERRYLDGVRYKKDGFITIRAKITVIP